ncbi:polyhydroxyalkanoate synthesis repressor PhaR [Celeribacter marinus]|uniref:polyhydroxyalkanoate synthesis repressor PhaR n=1 Tax=Celeribacter marinus TaxID=1397108 RepID=UPI003F6B9CC4
MADIKEPLLIKRYASRRLYNTETSDYVTLGDISEFIRGGREVQIVDLKSGDDLTRQYLLQIIAEHESRGENVLPLNVLNDLVRSYTTDVTSAVPQFLAQSFEMFRDGQEKMMQGLGGSIPGLGAVQAQQEAFMKAMTGGLGSLGTSWATPAKEPEPERSRSDGDDLDTIKKQLAELQDKLSKLK